MDTAVSYPIHLNYRSNESPHSTRIEQGEQNKDRRAAYLNWQSKQHSLRVLFPAEHATHEWWLESGFEECEH